MDTRDSVANDGGAQVTNMHLLGNIHAAQINGHRIGGSDWNNAERW